MRQLNPSSRNGAIMFSNQADISWSPKKKYYVQNSNWTLSGHQGKTVCCDILQTNLYNIRMEKKPQTCIYRLKVFLFYFIPYLTFLSFYVSYILWFDRDAYIIQRYLINLYLPDIICFVENALFGAYVWLKMIILLNLISNS